MRSPGRPGSPLPEPGAEGPVVVAVTGAPGNHALVERAARLAARSGAHLIGVHVRRPDAAAIDPALDDVRRALVALGASYREVVGDDVGAALVEAAQAEGATEVILGATGRTRLSRLFRGSIARRVLAEGDDLGVRVLAVVPPGRGPARARPVPARSNRRRFVASWVTAVLLVALTWALTGVRDEVDLASALLLYLLLVVGVAALGGRVVALAGAVAAFLLANWYLTPPLHTWKIAHTQNVVALLAFVSVAGVVSNFVAVASRRAAEAERARAEAESLARLAAAHADADPLAAVASHLRATFSLDGVSVLRRGGPGGEAGWVVEASAGVDPPASPDEASVVHSVGPDVVLACTGRRLTDDDDRVLHAFAAQLTAAVERADLARDAARADALERTNALRTALLQSLSHDLRTPLAAIKLSVSSLRDPSITWPADQRAEFLASIEDETDHLTRLVANLVDLGRIQTGELHPGITAVALEEVVPAAVHHLGATRVPVRLDLPADLPDVAADAALLERVVANLAGNAVRFSPDGDDVTVTGRRSGAHVVVAVIDHGPGIAPEARLEAVRPFQRLGDRRSDGGVGLGLAIADGFTRAMRGELRLVDTPGGGLTVEVVLPVDPSSVERSLRPVAVS